MMRCLMSWVMLISWALAIAKHSSTGSLKPRMTLLAIESDIEGRETHYSNELANLASLFIYIKENFLEDCGIYLLFDPRNMVEETQVLIEELGFPMMVTALDWSENGGLQLPKHTTLTIFRTCSAYMILSKDADDIQSFVLSKSFESALHYLGLYIFVTGAAAESPNSVLDNDVMARRPNAIVIRRVEKNQVLPTNRRADYEIWTHHVFRQDVTQNAYLVERWSQKAPQKRANLFPDKLNNFHQSELKAVTFEHAPAIIKFPYEALPDSGHQYDGIDIRLLHIVSEALNFNLKIVNPSDGGKWGYLTDNGSWNGLTGDLTNHRAHMGVANLFITTNYLEVVDMTTYYDFEFGCFITPLPEELPQWVALIYPFSNEVWICTGVFLILGTPILYLASKMSYHFLKDETSWATNLYHIVFYGLGIFFGQGMPQEPISNVTRSYFIMWVWYGILVTVVYKSSLTAFLTIPLKQPPIDTLEQLQASQLPSWGNTGLTFKKIMQESPDPLVQSLAERYLPVNNAKEGILLTAQRKYAMMENRQFLEYTIATNYTNQYGEETLHIMRECFLPFRIAMAVPKKSPYKINFDAIIMRVVEAGLVRKWFREILSMRQKRGDAGELDGTDGALTVYNLQSAWLLFGGGFLISIVTFFIEKVSGSTLGRQNPASGNCKDIQ